MKLATFPTARRPLPDAPRHTGRPAAAVRFPSFAPNYELKDAARQTVNLVNSSTFFLGKHTEKACATIAMGQTKQGYFFYEGCEHEECNCYAYRDTGTGELELVTEGYLYVIDYSSSLEESIRSNGTLHSLWWTLRTPATTTRAGWSRK